MDMEMIMRKFRDNAFGLLIVAICVIFAYKTYVKKEEGLKTLSGSADTEKKKNELLTEISTLEKKYSFFKDHVNAKAPATMITSLGNIAKDSSVKMTSIRPKAEEKAADYTRYPFELSVTGPDFHTIARFVSNLERAPEQYEIDSLDFSFDREGSNPTMTVRLTVSTILLN
jgi:Tfp pilus assembly protein PilO